MSRGDTHCWEPSLVFLPSLMKRLLGEAVGKLGGLGGSARSSSEESLILNIPVQLHFSQSSIRISSDLFLSWHIIPGKFHPGRAALRCAAAAAASFYAQMFPAHIQLRADVSAVARLQEEGLGLTERTVPARFQSERVLVQSESGAALQMCTHPPTARRPSK